MGRALLELQPFTGCAFAALTRDPFINKTSFGKDALLITFEFVFSLTRRTGCEEHTGTRHVHLGGGM